MKTPTALGPNSKFKIQIFSQIWRNNFSEKLVLIPERERETDSFDQSPALGAMWSDLNPSRMTYA